MIRRAAAEDIGALAGIETECFGPGAWSSFLLEGDLHRDSYRMIVATDGDALVGYGSISVAADLADLQRIAVRPHARRTGIARTLLTELLTTATGLGATRMLLEVAANNVPAGRLYTSAGFNRIGSRDNYYADGSDALVLERSLP